jgi:hypothetical protein
MEKKICSKCKEEKEVCEFQKNSHSKDGYRSECSLCSRNAKKLISKEILNKYSKKFRENNREKLKEKRKKYYYDNIEMEKTKSRKKYKETTKNKPVILPKTKEEIKSKKQEWVKNNRKTINEKKRYKYQNDIFYKLSHNVRNRLNSYLKLKNIQKKTKTFDLLGCTSEFLKKYLESQFMDGMNWDNRNEWHIDHKIPLSSAKTEEEIYELCHYTNLQPLWAFDNLSKGNKIL